MSRAEVIDASNDSGNSWYNDGYSVMNNQAKMKLPHCHRLSAMAATGNVAYCAASSAFLNVLTTPGDLMAS